MSAHGPGPAPGSSPAAGRPGPIPLLGRVIGADLGAVRVGVALSDPDQRLALPLVTVSRSADMAGVLARLARDEKAVGIVIGLPLSLDGSVGPAARSVLDEVQAVARASTVPVATHDERFTTVAATRHLQQAGRRPRRARDVVDQTAAAVMLQSWLDGRRGRGER